MKANITTEYATRYLERLGASPTVSNISMLLDKMPIDKCSVEGMWRKDGSLNDAIVVTVDGGRGSQINLKKIQERANRVSSREGRRDSLGGDEGD